MLICVLLADSLKTFVATDTLTADGKVSEHQLANLRERELPYFTCLCFYIVVPVRDVKLVTGC